MLDCVTEIPLPGRILAPPNATARGKISRDPLPAFVAGPENRLVASAMNELIESASPDDVSTVAKRFEPSVLVLFGASGTGKSHLAHGVVRHWQSQLGDDSARYTTAADFRHLLNDAIKRQAELEFRAEYRGRQLLAIDDLQHLPAGDYAWQELRYTLDDYEDRGATVLVTANEPVATLANVPTDVRSRLTCGLVLQLAPPGESARIRIIQQAANALHRPISPEAAQRLALGIDGTANSLFQAVFELIAPTTGRPSSDSARVDHVLAARAARQPTLREVIAVVARHQSIPQSQLKSGSRRQSIVFARGLIVFLARELAGISYEEIGRALGGRDHTTIIHNYQKIDEQRIHDLPLQRMLEDLRRILLSH
jgi:chromosomal replication initiator protein